MAAIFERASKKKLRFDTAKGVLTTEDLFDLPLLADGDLCLNDLAKKYNQRIKSETEDDFVGQDTAKPATDDKLKFDIVKHIIDYKVEAATRREEAAKRKQKRELILGLIDQKQNDELKEKSATELLAMLDEEEAAAA